MSYFVVIASAYVLLQVSACPDPITTVHIQNHDGPIYVSPIDRPFDNHRTCNQGTCNHGYQNQGTHNHPCGNTDNQLHHTYPYHISETDCKCVTKQLSTSVPINTVPQNTCTPGTYYSYPDYNAYYYPEGQYGAGGCPIAAEGIIPLLKSYLGQGKCPKHGCQCTQHYSSC